MLTLVLKSNEINLYFGRKRTLFFEHIIIHKFCVFILLKCLNRSDTIKNKPTLIKISMIVILTVRRFD